MKEKSTFHIYFNNSVAFIIFIILKLFLKKSNYPNDNILFINTGQIGDLIISSLIFENQSSFNPRTTIYFLVDSNYTKLFKGYYGKVKIINWEKREYKYNLFYRLRFLKRIRKIGFNKTFNLTTARGITNDELALLSGANEVFCLESNWRYLTKLFGKWMDLQYDKVIETNQSTEYNKHIHILKNLVGEVTNIDTKVYLDEYVIKAIKNTLISYLPKSNFDEIISIAPISDLDIKNWGIENYKNLINMFLLHTDATIILLGTSSQKKIIQLLNDTKSNRVINFAGQFTLLESASIVSISKIFIGNDSGFTHLAKALDKKMIGIIGGGSFGKFFPYNPKKDEILLYHKLDCFGCEWKCIKDKPYCHTNVTVDQVYQAAINLLIEK